jgi:methyl-galactoside transport system ATP-binding protein
MTRLASAGLFASKGFSLRKGEILGVAGLVGSRRTELLETLFGIKKIKSGEIKVHSKKVKISNPKEAIKEGFALLTEERRATGIFGGLSIKFNSVISNIKEYSKIGFLNDRKMTEDTKWVIDSMNVKTPGQKTHIRTLSGGNQQKVILGRWLLTNPEILMLDEPTRGIDVGAKYEIYQLILNLANKDKAVIMVSSEMPELLGICDRILVMSGGRVAGILNNDENISQEKILALASKYI